MVLELEPQMTAMLALAACAAVVLLLGVVVLLAVRVRTLGRRHARAFGEGDGARVVEVLGDHGEDLSRLHDELGRLEARTGELRDLLAGTVSKVGLVRYDAFDDMGGALSFSAALLDERADGVVISAINGRTETRCYAKPISGGASEHNLSAEEVTAVDAAIRGERLAAAPVPSRRRRRSS